MALQSSMVTTGRRVLQNERAKLHLVKKLLLEDPNAAEQLRLADNYMTQKKLVGKQFRMPAEHADLKPLVDAYAENLEAFVEYVKNLRESATPRGAPYLSLHELYRTLITRLTQQQRRERSARAIKWFKDHYPAVAYKQKMEWLLALEQSWGRRRMSMMDEHRRKTTSGRLNTDEREELLVEFWQEIDDEIEAGDLPAYKGAIKKAAKK